MIGYNGQRIKFGPRAHFGKAIKASMLPAGMEFHCKDCHIVIPADAPRPEGGDCIALARSRMCPFKPFESLAGQHVMAAAAWGLIYHAELKVNAHPESTEYNRRLWYDRKAHFGESAVRAGMKEEHVAADKAHMSGRDAWLYR